MKKNKGGFDNYLNELKEIAKGAPLPEEILEEFKRGDYSSLDPEFFKTGHDIAERFINSRKKKVQYLNKKIAQKPLRESIRKLSRS